MRFESFELGLYPRLVATLLIEIGAFGLGSLVIWPYCFCAGLLLKVMEKG